MVAGVGILVLFIAAFLNLRPGDQQSMKPMNIIVDEGYCGWFYIFNVADSDLPNYDFPVSSPLNAVGRRGIVVRGHDWLDKSKLQFFETGSVEPLVFKRWSVGTSNTRRLNSENTGIPFIEYVVSGSQDCDPMATSDFSSASDVFLELVK